MSALGPHAVFILAAYGVTFAAIAALVLTVVGDDRAQQRILAELERKGIRRRSAAAKPPGPRTAAKPAEKRSARAGRPPPSRSVK
ncbi:MAG: heme exporter protein CcmD [Methyloceanibacter sp.]